jgi:hypothetical protein
MRSAAIDHSADLGRMSEQWLGEHRAAHDS